MFPLVWADQRGDGYLLVSCLKFKDDVIICGHELGVFNCTLECAYRDRLKKKEDKVAILSPPYPERRTADVG